MHTRTAVKPMPRNMSPAAPSCSAMLLVNMAADAIKTSVILRRSDTLGEGNFNFLDVTPSKRIVEFKERRRALELAREGERVVCGVDVWGDARQRRKGQQRDEYAHDDLAQRARVHEDEETRLRQPPEAV